MSNKSKVLAVLRSSETAPTLEEIAKKAGITVDQVHNAVRGLQQYDEFSVSFITVRTHTVKLTERRA